MGRRPGTWRAGGWIAAALASGSAVPAIPAMAQDEPVGPCSPYHAADGDIASEMPGCARHRRPAPGSLDDELRFRRARDGVAVEDPPADDDAPPRRRTRRARPR